MSVSHLHKSLFLLTVIGLSFLMLSLLTIHQPQQVVYNTSSAAGGANGANGANGGSSSNLEDLLAGRAISLRIDETVVNNITDRVLHSIRTDNILCNTIRGGVGSNKIPTIYFITPTYKRPEQIPDLTRLSQTLMHVPNIMWLIIEDAESLNPQVSDLLRRSGIQYQHMIAPMPKEEQKKKIKARGVSNRNKGLDWIRNNYVDEKGVVYFADDDNTYDLRLFHEIRSVRKIGMWPVGLITHYGVSSPVVKNGHVVGFYDGWVANRKYPVDMAGFAVSVDLILKKPKLRMPFVPGYEEDGFLKSLNIKLEDIEPKADNCTKIYVWHTQTKKNKAPVKVNLTMHGSTNIWTLYKQIEI